MYHNPFTPGYEVLSKSGYNIDSHGSLSNTAAYLITNDFPDYTAMFYSPTEHETMTSIKYGNFEQGYHNLNEVRDSMNGPPMEFYIPQSFSTMEGNASINTKPIEIIKDVLMDRINKEALREITKAQEQVSRRVKKIEFEDVLLLRKIKRTIVFED
ncbi:hypothetical protein CMO93_01850 [Candidatus Woesearchaeota archaeon]|nr:hypothetical protein [Candidatus Woesearchaeota archaeon]|tara:strand:+ start:1284 stop:1751 length:468 start_codon:yes stop_codon:yes gene_type:complete